MRIALIGPTHPYQTGAAQFTTELAHRLAGAGHDVRLESWYAQYPKRLYPGETATGESEFPLFEPTERKLAWYRPDTWARAGRRLRKSADLVVLSVLTPVQVPPYLAIISALRAGGRKKAPRIVALCHNVAPHEKRGVDVKLMRTLLSRVDGVLVHSAEQAGIAREFTTAPVNVATLPPHLPTPTEAAPAPADEAVRNRLLFFGIVRPYKGVDLLLRALAAGPDGVSLTIAGEFWGSADEYEALIDELGLRDRVTIRAGYVSTEELPGLFAAADALVLPYRTATSSQNAWIAFEHGIPVIATRAGTLADPVTDGVDGIVCAPGDVGELTAALRRFYEPGTPQRLRAAVRPVDPEPYWKRYVDALAATP